MKITVTGPGNNSKAPQKVSRLYLSIVFQVTLSLLSLQLYVITTLCFSALALMMNYVTFWYLLHMYFVSQSKNDTGV